MVWMLRAERWSRPGRGDWPGAEEAGARPVRESEHRPAPDCHNLNWLNCNVECNSPGRAQLGFMRETEMTAPQIDKQDFFWELGNFHFLSDPMYVLKYCAHSLKIVFVMSWCEFCSVEKFQ